MASSFIGGCWNEARDETDGGNAWVDGEPERLIYPTDSRGRLCGVHDAVRDKPFLLFFDIKQCATVVSVSELLAGEVDTDTIFTCPTQQVCVAECPEENEFGVRNNPVCVDEVDPDKYRNVTDLNSGDSNPLVLDLVQDIANERCAPYYLRSEAVARRCIPTFLDLRGIVNDTINFEPDPALNDTDIREVITGASIDSIVNGSFAQALLVEARQFLLEVYRDFTIVWPALLIGVGVTVAVSFLYILLMWLFAPVIVWVTIIAVPLLVLAISGFSYYQFYCFQDTENLFNRFDSEEDSLTDFLNSTETLSARLCVQTEVFRSFISSQLPWFRYQKETWLAIGIIGTVFVVVIVLILIFLGKKIRISIAIIQEAAKAVGGVPTSVFYPVLTWLLLIMLFLVLVDTTMGVLAVYNGSRKIGNISCLFDEFVTSNTLLGMHIYHLFGLLWIGKLHPGPGRGTLAGAFASWYGHTGKPKDVPLFAVLGSLGRAFLFHSGSLAFGALIIAIIQMIRIILAYLQRKLKDKTGRITKIIFCILQCCFWLLEKFFKYVNRQAYIETAVKDRIVAFLLFLGKIFIVCVIGVLAYLGFGPYQDQGEKLWGQPLNYYLIPVMIARANNRY
ncbi:Choline transporter-like protein 2 [Geodia barretti]|uniref:Choline transporter-like protein n=1 Tax=Geodia barretti TaxID=519541 RepID=A0AA35W2K9_GEOBA|nr:Choline transporter-like protein 2 [Geodia barretti]